MAQPVLVCPALAPSPASNAPVDIAHCKQAAFGLAVPQRIENRCTRISRRAGRDDVTWQHPTSADAPAS
jgi:hypothetical protein